LGGVQFLLVPDFSRGIQRGTGLLVVMIKSPSSSAKYGKIFLEKQDKNYTGNLLCFSYIHKRRRMTAQKPKSKYLMAK
jgi:hypothetical protein